MQRAGGLRYSRLHSDACSRARTYRAAPGALLVTVGLMAAVLAFSQGPSWGWGDPRTLAGFLASALLLAGFAVRGRRAVAPLMDLSIFKVRNVSGANGMMAAVFAGNLGMFFLLTLYL